MINRIKEQYSPNQIHLQNQSINESIRIESVCDRLSSSLISSQFSFLIQFDHLQLRLRDLIKKLFNNWSNDVIYRSYIYHYPLRLMAYKISIFQCLKCDDISAQ